VAGLTARRHDNNTYAALGSRTIGDIVRPSSVALVYSACGNGETRSSTRDDGRGRTAVN
jgi:hypothetical protein